MTSLPIAQGVDETSDLVTNLMVKEEDVQTASRSLKRTHYA